LSATTTDGITDQWIVPQAAWSLGPKFNSHGGHVIIILKFLLKFFGG